MDAERPSNRSCNHGISGVVATTALTGGPTINQLEARVLSTCRRVWRTLGNRPVAEAFQ